MSEWISVNDRLPEIKKFRESDKVLLLEFDRVDDYKESVFTGTVMKGGGEVEFYTDEYIKLYCVTHWMPLPESPKAP